MMLAEIITSRRNGGIGVIMISTIARTAMGTPRSCRPARRGGGTCASVSNLDISRPWGRQSCLQPPFQAASSSSSAG